ncbi:MAG TPA: non-homologous end-joining DNA ligase [Acidimicrobiales bacterium]|nr:non-homologous end-joining DNA ligase [Acidimicrobiales bacterium]
MAGSGQGTEVTIGKRKLSLSNLDKVLWPATGFTKGEMIDYYARVAPTMVPHLAGRAITLRRWPNGVDASSFFEKNCPSHRPPWMETVELGDVGYCRLDEPAAIVWTANLAAIELHPTLAAAPDLERPTFVVFDLDPGAPADILTCVRVAQLIREVLDHLGLQAWPKTSGSKGLQLYVPTGGTATYAETREFSQNLAHLLERAHPELVVSTQEKARRAGKILIDWSQNTSSKTTVAVYSLRARDEPSASTPVTWEEMEAAASREDAEALRFSPAEVLQRIEEKGDLMAPVLEVSQELPALG